MLESSWLLLVGLMLSAGVAAAPSSVPVWRGTIGAAAVVVELDPTTQSAYGRYFYTRYLRDIPLDGNRADTTLHLHEPAADETAAAAEWVLDTGGADELRGEWIGPDGRRLAIRLSRFDVARVHDRERARLLRDDPYEYLRSARLRIEPGKLETVGDYRLQWFVEPHTQVSLFQIVSGYPDAARERINRVLRERHWQQIGMATSCMSASNGDYESTTTLRRIDSRILSVSLFASFYCGGAHPDFGDDPLNLDPRTGRVLELEDVLWLGQGAPPRFEGHTQSAFFEYRDNTLGPWLAAKMAKLHPGDVMDEDAGCDYTDPEVWKYVSWYARDDGLYLGPGFARASRNCEYPEWPVLPWKDIEQHPGGVRIGPGTSPPPK